MNPPPSSHIDCSNDQPEFNQHVKDFRHHRTCYPIGALKKMLYDPSHRVCSS
jgi:hypothetical protein